MRAILQINRSLAKKSAMDHSGKSLSEASLLREWEEVQAAQSNPAAFRVLYDRYYEPVFRYLHRRTMDEAMSADLCSQVFLKALQKLGKYQYKGVPFSAWLFRIASNEMGQYFRESGKKRVVSLESVQLQELGEEMEDVDKDELQAVMIKALDQLKPSDLEIIEMRFFEQRPYKEIAEILGISLSNAKVKVHRILDRLKRKLNG